MSRIAVALAVAAISPSGPAGDHHRPCAQRFTIAAYERWIRAHAHAGQIPRAEKPAMWRLERCQAHGQPARLAGIRWRIHYLRSITYAIAHPLLTAIASWYDDAGTTGCGFHAGLGVANKDLACGTRVQFDYHGREVTAVVDDRGPYVGGRTWDLNQSTAGALGFSGVDVVRYRVLP